MFQLIVTVIVLLGLATYLLVNSEPAREVARVVTGFAAIVLALILILG